MSLVDRWLSRPPANTEAATFATSATLPKTGSISAAFDVASRPRHAATYVPVAPGSSTLSQAVAGSPRRENPQNSRPLNGMSQMSQMSQGAASARWNEIEEERAAIFEHDGKIPRTWAEGYARLHPDHPLADVPPKRWQQFIDDIGRFLDGGWAEKATVLGWGPLNLFGCDRERPFARLDHAGLLWLLNGDKLVELDCHRAVIERRTGSRQVFRRRPLAVGEVVLAWELVA
jgi:hypothetical protein